VLGAWFIGVYGVAGIDAGWCRRNSYYALQMIASLAFIDHWLLVFTEIDKKSR
jgi:hypothetical protein